MNRNFKKSIALIVLLVAALLGMVIFSIVMTNKKVEAPGRVTTADEDSGPIHFTGEVVTLSGDTISFGIHDMGELVTSEYYYTHAEDLESVKTMWGIKVPFSKTSLVYKVDGCIKAGIDFTKVTVDVDNQEKTVKITLPESRIISSEIDHDSFELVNEKEGWFNELSAEDVNKTFSHVKELEEEKAIENGVLSRADENAARILESFVKSSFDLKDYTVEVGA